MGNLEVSSMQETNPAEKRTTPGFIYRPKINQKKNGSVFITYRNSQGKDVTYEAKNRYSYSQDAVLLFETIKKYFTGKNPNITPEEQIQIRADIAKHDIPIGAICYGADGGWEELDVYGGIDFVLKTFSDEHSEGGKDITPNEVYQMFEIFHCWTKEDLEF